MGSLNSKCIKDQTNNDRHFDYSVINTNVEVFMKESCLVEFNPLIRAYGYVSKAGYMGKPKLNQDRLLFYFDIDTKSLIFGVFDGHGNDGHLVAEYFRDKFLSFILSSELLTTKPCDAITLSISQAENEMIDSNAVDCICSGCTALIGLITNSTLYTVNVGDSRAYYKFINRETMKLQCNAISVIHSPDQEEEKERILEHGGRVSTIHLLHGASVPRVYVSDSNIGGLAMSRSIGDIALRKYGVISEPDIYITKLTPDVKAILFGSDGLSTYYSASRCFSLIEAGDDITAGLKKLAQHIYDDAYESTNACYVDDLSGIYVSFNND